MFRTRWVKRERMTAFTSRLKGVSVGTNPVLLKGFGCGLCQAFGLPGTKNSITCLREHLISGNQLLLSKTRLTPPLYDPQLLCISYKIPCRHCYDDLHVWLVVGQALENFPLVFYARGV